MQGVTTIGVAPVTMEDELPLEVPSTEKSAEKSCELTQGKEIVYSLSNTMKIGV